MLMVLMRTGHADIRLPKRSTICYVTRFLSISMGNMETCTLKNLKAPSFLLRTALILLITLVAFYTCYVSINQVKVEGSGKGIVAAISFYKRTFQHKATNAIGVMNAKQDQLCRDVAAIPPDDMQYIHFPQPRTYSREECSCTPVRFFAIVSMQRSGSGWFETLLNSHPNISSNGEIFQPPERRDNVSTLLRTLDTVYNLDWFTSAAKNECTAAYGLKWMLNQGLMEYSYEILKYFKMKGVSLIFLFRRNSLRRVVSTLSNNYDKQAKQINGTHVSHVHSEEEASILARYKPKLNVKNLISEIRKDEAMMERCLRHFNSTRHIVLYYEDIINNEKALYRVQKFLQVPARKLFSRQVKIHTRPLPELIKNWEAVRGVLNGTAYTHLLRDDDYLSGA